MRSTENPHAGQGPVLLDVGGEIGALLVTMPTSLEGVEIEIRPQEPGLEPHAHSISHPHSDHDSSSHSHPHSADRADHARSPDCVVHPHLTHVEVLPRPTPTGFITCAVFPELTQGRYELYERPSGPVRLLVSITGGQVTQASWPITDGPIADVPGGPR